MERLSARTVWKPKAVSSLADQSEAPAHRPRHGKPHLALAFWPRDCRHPKRFWANGRTPHSSGTSRLARHGICEERLEHQENAPSRHAFFHLQDGQQIRAGGEPEKGSDEPISLA